MKTETTDTTSHNSADEAHTEDFESEDAPLAPPTEANSGDPFDIHLESPPKQPVDEDPTSPPSKAPTPAPASHQEGAEIPVGAVAPKEECQAVVASPDPASAMTPAPGPTATIDSSVNQTAPTPEPTPMRDHAKPADEASASKKAAGATTKERSDAEIPEPSPAKTSQRERTSGGEAYNGLPDKAAVAKQAKDAACNGINALPPPLRDMGQLMYRNFGIPCNFAIFSILMTINSVFARGFNIRTRHRVSPLTLWLLLSSPRGFGRSSASKMTMERLLKLCRQTAYDLEPFVLADFSGAALADFLSEVRMPYSFIYEPEGRFLGPKLISSRDDSLQKVCLAGFCGEPIRRHRKNSKIDVASFRAGAFICLQDDITETILAHKEFNDSGLCSRILIAHATESGQHLPIDEEESEAIISAFDAYLKTLLPLLISTADGEPVELMTPDAVSDLLDLIRAETDEQKNLNPSYPWPRRHEIMIRLVATYALAHAAWKAMEAGCAINEVAQEMEVEHLLIANQLVIASENYATPKIPNAVVRSTASRQAKWSDAIAILTANGGAMKKSDFQAKAKIWPAKFDEFLKDCPSVEVVSVKGKGGRGARPKYVRFKSAPKAAEDAPEDAPEAPVASEDPVAPEGPTSASEGDSDELLGIDDLTL
jgi:hypothetical protein